MSLRLIRAPATCADKSEAEHKETAARNQILEDKLLGLEGVMEGALLHTLFSNPLCPHMCLHGLHASPHHLHVFIHSR